MDDIRKLLRAADPLQHEKGQTSGERDFRRQVVLTAASAADKPAEAVIEATEPPKSE